MMKQITLLFCIIVLTSACSLYHVNSEEISENYYPPKPAIDDIAYVEEITQPHEIIGFVTVNAERNQKIPEVMAKMKKEAAAIGGDAITDITTNATGTWKKIRPQKLMENAYIRANFTATVVVYK